MGTAETGSSVVSNVNTLDQAFKSVLNSGLLGDFQINWVRTFEPKLCWLNVL